MVGPVLVLRHAKAPHIEIGHARLRGRVARIGQRPPYADGGGIVTIGEGRRPVGQGAGVRYLRHVGARPVRNRHRHRQTQNQTCYQTQPQTCRQTQWPRHGGEGGPHGNGGT